MAGPSVANVKRLFAVSGNRCTFPGCAQPLVDEASGRVTGRVCHIKAESPGGPRYDPEQSEEERHGFANLVLMCPLHHDVIDSDIEKYTMERLLEIKARHEARYAGGAEPSDDVARQFVLQFAELLERLRRLLADDPTLAARLAAITGDGNVVGDHNVATVTKQSAGDYAIQIGQLHLTLSPDRLRRLRVFLCHTSGDKPAVRDLYHRLRADGIDPWLDEENLLPGQDWQLEIPKALRSSDAAIICLSSRAITKAGYVQKEIRYALDAVDELPEGTFSLVGVKLEECQIPERLNRWQWINLSEANGYERLRQSLSALAVRLIAAATLRPAFDYEPLQRVTLARRELAIIEQEAMGYTVLTLPADIAVKLDEKRKQVKQLEAALTRGQGRLPSHEDLPPRFVSTYDIFLSYSREDDDIMHHITSSLQREGLNVWVDETDIEVGTPAWEMAIEDALEHSRCLVVLLSPDSKHSLWVVRELSYAERHGIRIFPVLVRGDETDAVPVRLSSTMWVDARSESSKALLKLVTAVRRHVGADSVPQAAP